MLEPGVLLLTDIVDSTLLTAPLGDAGAAALWQAHDRAARSLLAPWRGRELDKSDGVMLLFRAVADAVGYAADYHRALAGLTPPLRARAAVHTALLEWRENSAEEVAVGARPSEVDSSAKPVVARLLSIAQGGQTLLSAQARAALGEAAAQRHGHWRLKGIEVPVEVHAVGDGAAEPPRDSAKAWRVVRSGELWLPARAQRHSLPSERDHFVGRGETLVELAHCFDRGARLVCLWGIGGIGKTRLAQRFGWTWLGDYPGGVWFCDLSAARTLEGVVHAVAQGLALPLSGADPVGLIGDALAGRGECLLIVDNFEQVVQHAEATLGRWLGRAGELRILATSREHLGIPGEQLVAVPSLPSADAVRLFVSRAHAATGRALDTEQHSGVAALVDLLDGLPLAIELAASRSRVMSPRGMRERIGERFKLLASQRGRGERQATLRGALDWSWDLLAEPERAALAQLSVFEGGFTLEAAEAVLDVEAEGAPWVVDLVQALVQKSLVRQSQGQRFDLLPTVQDYAGEHLARRGGTLPAQARHWRHFASLGEGVSLDDGADADAAIFDADNLVVATRRALAVGAGEAAVGALSGVFVVLRRTGPVQVAAELAQAAMVSLRPSGEAAAQVHWITGCALAGLDQARAAIEQSRAGLACTAADGPLAARLHSSLAESLGQIGQMVEAGSHFDRALAIALARADDRLACQTLNGRGAWLLHQSRLQDARQCYTEALALARRIGDRRWEGGHLGNLGAIEHMVGHADLARQHYEAALAHLSASGYQPWEGNTRCNLGLLYQEAGQHTEAEQQFDAALAIARHHGRRRLEATVLCNIGLLLDAQQRYADAAAQYRAAADLAQRIDDARTAGQALGYLGLALARRGRRDVAVQAFAEGAEHLERLGDTFNLGLLRCAQADAALLAGEGDAARAALALAVHALRHSDAGEESELARRVAGLEAALQPARE